MSNRTRIRLENDLLQLRNRHAASKPLRNRRAVSRPRAGDVYLGALTARRRLVEAHNQARKANVRAFITTAISHIDEAIALLERRHA